jgi:hypothetical protein
MFLNEFENLILKKSNHHTKLCYFYERFQNFPHVYKLWQMILIIGTGKHAGTDA